MGTELAPRTEWNHDASLDWGLAHAPGHGGFRYYVEQLGAMYRAQSPLWRHDSDPHGFAWVDVADRDNSIVSFVRRDGEDHVLVLLNMTPVPREHYRIGAPAEGEYVELLSSDDLRFGGSDFGTPKRLTTEPAPFHGYPQSLALRLPPLAAVVLAPARQQP
jgi:1,4-alpha-glucan branching enzyme